MAWEGKDDLEAAVQNAITCTCHAPSPTAFLIWGTGHIWAASGAWHGTDC